MKKIVFRVDSGTHIGIGHLMRCFTLAIELRSNFSILFICKDHVGANYDFIQSQFPVKIIEGGVKRALTEDEKNNYTSWLGESWEEDLARTNEIIRGINIVNLVIVDHYSLDERYEKGLFTELVMVIDDLTNRKHNCQLLLDQNISAVKSEYQRLTLPETRLLIGPQYALLKEEYGQYHKKIQIEYTDRPVKNILVFFGASDINGDTLKFAKATMQENFSKEYVFTFVLSDLHKDFKELSLLLAQYQNAELFHLVPNFIDLILKSDLFIGAGGTTSWERACLGVASALLAVADNQLRVCEELARREIAHYLGKSQEITPAKWKTFFTEIVPNTSLWYRCRTNAFNLIDGLGTKKVTGEIKKLVYG